MASKPGIPKRSPVYLRPNLKGTSTLRPAALRCRQRFLKSFPGGFQDETYLDWERNYKWEAHERFGTSLRRSQLLSAVDAGDYEMIAKHAIAVESRTNLLFSFEKMALRDAVRSGTGARAFAVGLYEFLYGKGTEQNRFETWVEVIAALPRKQTRVLTWPLVTVFGFIAEPEKHIFVKPLVTRRAAEAYGFPFVYESRPNWNTYVSLLEFAKQVRVDQQDLKPRDMIDLQSFIWVQGSDEYE